MRIRSLATYAAPLFLAASPSIAQSADQSTAEFTLRSEQIDETYSIQVGLPKGYGESDRRYRLVYVLDGNSLFDSTQWIARSLAGDALDPGVSGLIVVGIGYEDANTSFLRRQRDYNPDNVVPDAAVEWLKQQAPGVELARYSGGADDFLEFIRTKLDPKIRADYHVSDAKAGLLGGSSGAILAMHALSNNDPLFDRYLMASIAPLTITEDDHVEKMTESLQTQARNDVRVFMTVGEKEIGHPMYGEVAATHNKLLMAINKAAADGLIVESKVIPNATHMQSALPALQEGIRFLFRDVPAQP